MMSIDVLVVCLPLVVLYFFVPFEGFLSCFFAPLGDFIIVIDNHAP